MRTEERPEEEPVESEPGSDTEDYSEATVTEELTRGGGRAERGRADLILIAHPSRRLLGNRYPLEEGERRVVGRSSSADIRLPGVTSVSRRHAVVSFERGIVTVRDLGSTNGTYVDGRRVTSEPVALRSGDRFQIGGIHFKLLRQLDIETAYHDTLFELAVRDGLTGALNRRRFEEELEREVGRARRHGRALTVILFDVDRFKRVNDHHGHVVGDQVLRSVVASAQAELEEEEVLARVGGEEFGVLVPEASIERAHQLAQRLRRRIARGSHECLGGACVTCSFGVASLQEGDRVWQELYRRADEALYRAKSAGRNRVVRG